MYINLIIYIFFQREIAFGFSNVDPDQAPHLVVSALGMHGSSLTLFSGCWLVRCFEFNGPLRQYFSLYRAEVVGVCDSPR